MSAHFTAGQAETRYALNYDTARSAAEEAVKEWSYKEDPHGYCHQRPVLVALLARINELAALDGLSVLHRRLLIRTAHAYGTGYVYRNPLTGEETPLNPRNVTVVISERTASTSTAPTPAQILATPMGENDADATTIREYLAALARGAWTDGEFSGKRPFGSSSWRYEVYAALGDAGHIRYVRDEDGYCEECDTDLGDKLILAALDELAAGPSA